MGEVMTALLDKLKGYLKDALEIALWLVALLTLLQVYNSKPHPAYGVKKM